MIETRKYVGESFDELQRINLQEKKGVDYQTKMFVSKSMEKKYSSEFDQFSSNKNKLKKAPMIDISKPFPLDPPFHQSTAKKYFILY